MKIDISFPETKISETFLAFVGNDLRLVGKYELVESDGDWRLRVEARVPTASE